MAVEGRYRAPALAKGLEILEVLARSAQALPMTEISTALGRSVSEIFRMLQVLEEHGYIARSGEGYRLTNRLFSLALSQPPVRDLLAAALPVMRSLAESAQQSCHLAVVSGPDIVVIATVETPGLLGFAVRMGYRRPLVKSASGHVLLAYQSEETRDRMLGEVTAAGVAFDEPELLEKLATVRATGQIAMSSPMLTAITDLSSPVLDGGIARAALTMPFVDGAGAALPRDDAAAAVRAAAAALSH